MKPVNYLPYLSYLPIGLICSFLHTTSFAATATAPASSVAATAATTATATATTVAVTPSAPGNLIQIIVSLILVVGLLIALSIAFKKFGLDRLHSSFPVKIIGAISIGSNQRLMVIEAGDEWVVLGITPQAISPLTSMPRQENGIPGQNANTNITPGADKPPFSTWMQSTLEKYRVKKM